MSDQVIDKRARLKMRPEVSHLSGRVLVDGKEMAALLGFGLSQFGKLRRQGLILNPIRFGEFSPYRVRNRRGPECPVRWRFAEVLDWVAAGCPPAADWRWVPTVRVRVAEAHELLCRQSEEIRREIQELEDRKLADDAFVSVRPR